MGNSSSADEESIFGSDGKTPRLYENASKIRPDQWPILYSPVYNIGFLGFEKMHPFDSGKWGKVHQFLIDKGMLKDSSSTLEPEEANTEELLQIHTREYLQSLKTSYNVAMVVEVPPVALLPNALVQRRMLRPFRYHTAGTIMAGKLAKERGWAINIGGGFHHCSSKEGGGFCAYADITLCVKFMFDHMNDVKKVMIVDFDAHQGNGHERDFLHDSRVHIMDMYNKWIYPNDTQAKAAIETKIELSPHTEDDTYLSNITRDLPPALNHSQPDVVVYNAGTDILMGDPLGALDITPDGVMKRDEIVFEEVRKRGIPIVMVTSGGYQRNNAQVIADSLLNLKAKKLILAPEDDPHISLELKRQGASLENTPKQQQRQGGKSEDPREDDPQIAVESQGENSEDPREDDPRVALERQGGNMEDSDN